MVKSKAPRKSHASKAAARKSNVEYTVKPVVSNDDESLVNVLKMDISKMSGTQILAALKVWPHYKNLSDYQIKKALGKDGKQALVGDLRKELDRLMEEYNDNEPAPKKSPPKEKPKVPKEKPKVSKGETPKTTLWKWQAYEDVLSHRFEDLNKPFNDKIEKAYQIYLLDIHKYTVVLSDHNQKIRVNFVNMIMENITTPGNTPKTLRRVDLNTPEDKPKSTPQKQTTFSFTYKLGAAIYTYPDEPANTTFRTILTRIVSKWFGGHNIKDYQIYDDEDKLVTDYDQHLDNYEEYIVFNISKKEKSPPKEKPVKPTKPKKNTSKEGSPPKVKKCLLPDQEVYIICFWDKQAYDHNPDMGGQDASYVLPNADWDNRISAAREFLKDTNPKLANGTYEELGDMMRGMPGVTYNNDLYYIDMFKGKVLKNM